MNKNTIQPEDIKELIFIFSLGILVTFLSYLSYHYTNYGVELSHFISIGVIIGYILRLRRKFKKEPENNRDSN